MMQRANHCTFTWNTNLLYKSLKQHIYPVGILVNEFWGCFIGFDSEVF